MTYRGHIKNGQIVLEESPPLPEGAVVTVEVVEAGDGRPTIWQELLDIAGTAHGLPEDMSKNHDHYLYGTPKKE